MFEEHRIDFSHVKVASLYFEQFRAILERERESRMKKKETFEYQRAYEFAVNGEKKK